MALYTINVNVYRALNEDKQFWYESTMKINANTKKECKDFVTTQNTRVKAIAERRNSQYPYLEYEYLSVKSIDHTMGKDGYGTYHICTGHEAPHKCFWCGQPAKFRYCCAEHRVLYNRHFHWHDAVYWCFERYHNVCNECGGNHNLEVHHIDPLNVGDRNWSKKNQPDNLELLCQSCHDKKHSKKGENGTYRKTQVIRL